MEIIDGLFDAHFNGVDVLWGLIAVGLAVIGEYAAAKGRERHDHAHADLMRASELSLMDPELVCDGLFTDWPPGRATIFDWKQQGNEPRAVAQRQQAAYRYLAGVRGRDEYAAAAVYGFVNGR